MGARALKVNFAINMVGAVIPLVVSLATVPIYVRHLGDARYGVMSIVWVLLGYFGFLDLGLSRAAANALAKLRTAPQADRARVLVTTLGLNLGLGVIGAIGLAFGGGYLLQHVLTVPDALKPEIAQAFPWIVALFPLALISGVGIGALESRERFALANVLQVGGTALGQIVPVLLAVGVSPSLAVVIPAAAIARALTVVALLAVVYRAEGPLSPRDFDRKQAGKLLSYGGWVTVTGLINPFLTSLDQFVIGSLLGVAAVAHYAVPMSLVIRSQIFPFALSRTLFPRMSSSGPAEAERLASRAFVCLTYGYGAICAPAVVFTPVFFRYWIGADFSAIASPVAQMLFIGAWLNGLAFVPYELLQSQGRPDVTGKFHAAEVLPFIGILYGFTAAFGIVGSAAAWSLRCAVDALLLFWAARMRRVDLLRALAPFAILIAAALLGHSLGANLVLGLGAAVVVGLASAALALIMADDLRALAVTLLGRALHLTGRRAPDRWIAKTEASK